MARRGLVGEASSRKLGGGRVVNSMLRMWASSCIERWQDVMIAVWGVYLKKEESSLTRGDCFYSLSWSRAPRLAFSGANVLVLRVKGVSFPAHVVRNCGF